MGLSIQRKHAEKKEHAPAVIEAVMDKARLDALSS
jgi:hypothetical protein